MDIDWKGILDKALTVGGPLLGAAANAEAPGTGALVVAGTQALDTYVVKPYVPGTEAQTAQPQPTTPQPATPQPATPQPTAAPSDAHRAASFLADKGWTEMDVAQHLKGPQPACAVTPAQAAAIVHGTLAEVGWHPQERDAILRGPYAFYKHLEPAQHVPDADFQAEHAQHDVGHIHRRGLYKTTEPAGYAPTNYHGTADAHLVGLGEVTEQAGHMRARKEEEV